MNSTLNRLNPLGLLLTYFLQILSNIILLSILKISHVFSSLLIFLPKPYMWFLYYVTSA